MSEKSKFGVNDRVFVCDGEEYHGKVVTIIKVYTGIDEGRYDAILPEEKNVNWSSPFRFVTEIKFCNIEKGTCELCGSSEGIVKPPYPEKEFGDVHDFAMRKFPYAVTCICPVCQKILNFRDEKLNQRNKKRCDFRDAERARRKKEGLCEECGGNIIMSGPYLVYEGTYETRCLCDHCGKENCYT